MLIMQKSLFKIITKKISGNAIDKSSSCINFTMKIPDWMFFIRIYHKSFPAYLITVSSFVIFYMTAMHENLIISHCLCVKEKILVFFIWGL